MDTLSTIFYFSIQKFQAYYSTNNDLRSPIRDKNYAYDCDLLFAQKMHFYSKTSHRVLCLYVINDFRHCFCYLAAFLKNIKNKKKLNFKF